MRDDVSKSMALHSGEYVKKYANKPVTRVANLVAKMIIGPNDIIADYACGNGMLLEVLPTARGSYHGVDFSKDFINSANRRATENGSENYSFHCQDITEFTATRENRFDISATLDFSEHISDRMFVEIYSAIRSSMKPGAKLYIHTPNLNFFIERLKDIGIMRQFPEHIGVRTAHQYRQLLPQRGFDPGNIYIEVIPHYNILRHLHFLRHLPTAGHLFAARLWITVFR